jgi:transposase-like protein
MLDLTEYVETLRHVTRTDPDPRVRHRADALLLLAHGRRVEEVADDSGCCTKRIRVWRRRFLADGRDGLADRPRSGRPRPSMRRPEPCWSGRWPPPRWTTATR